MKEKELIQIIKSTLNSEYIGDDCAYLPDLGITVTQDSLVEDIHFSMKYTNAYKLGWKSAMVNISDVCASGANPVYLTIALSLPKNIKADFVEEFYKGAKDACEDVKIVGGDITGSEKIFISVTAIGSTKGRKISSRSHAKAGYKIIVSGKHGSSGAGLISLIKGLKYPDFIEAHLIPKAQRKFSEQIAVNALYDYAMMDTSDGLADALYQIADASNVIMKIDFEKIPYDKNIEKFSDWKDLILFGGEDYQLVAAVPEELLKNISDYTIIGEVIERNNKSDGKIIIDGKYYSDIDNKLYNHFEE